MFSYVYINKFTKRELEPYNFPFSITDSLAKWLECSPVDRSSNPGRVIPKTQKMVLDAVLLNTQHYKVRINGRVKQSRERSCALPYTSV